MWLLNLREERQREGDGCREELGSRLTEFRFRGPITPSGLLVSQREPILIKNSTLYGLNSRVEFKCLFFTPQNFTFVLFLYSHLGRLLYILFTLAVIKLLLKLANRSWSLLYSEIICSSLVHSKKKYCIHFVVLIVSNSLKNIKTKSVIF